MNASEHIPFMERCLQLAKRGVFSTSPNPMVGAVIVHNHKIIGEGFHLKPGQPHAEIMAINAVKEKALLKESTIYVSLEPCSHFGKTPPCAERLIHEQIPKVVIACRDLSAKVNGRGISMLKQHGVEVVEGVLEKEAIALNKRFFSFHKNKRSFVTLKWAQSKDGYMDRPRLKQEKGSFPISSNKSKVWVHKHRAAHDAILVGAGTAITDNPRLNTREFYGKDPLRILVKNKRAIPQELNLLKNSNHLVWDTSNYEKPIHALLAYLVKRDIQSVLVEGGAFTLNQFIKNNLWDEIYIIEGNIQLSKGLHAPIINQKPTQKFRLGKDMIYHISAL